MKNKTLTLSTLTVAGLLLAPAVAPPAAAGEYKCEAEATVCVGHMVDELRQKGWIGIEISDEGDAPATIKRVVAGSPAEQGGFREGDEFLALNGVLYSTMKDDKEAMKATKKALAPGNRVTFTVGRGGRELDLHVIPTHVPDHILAQWVGQHVIEYHIAQAENAPKAPAAPSSAAPKASDAPEAPADSAKPKG